MEDYKTLREYLPTSIYASIGYIGNESDLEILKKYLNFNKVIGTFPHILAVQNANSNDLLEKACVIWKETFGDKVTCLSPIINKGHTFGTMELDNMVFEYTQTKPKIKWVWKSSNDMVFDLSILDKTVTGADIYYINNIGFNAFNQFGDFNKLLEAILNQTYRYPQTTFYIVKNKIKELNPTSEIEQCYKMFNENNPDGKKPWELIHGFDCETMLSRYISDNKLKAYHLLDDKSLHKLLSVIYHYQIHDGSHKNILLTKLGNLCHYQYPNQGVIQI